MSKSGVISSYLRAFGTVECLHQVHSLFRVDRTVNGGIGQSMPLKVQLDNFQHAGPLGDNDTGRKNKNPTQLPDKHTELDEINSSAGLYWPRYASDSIITHG